MVQIKKSKAYLAFVIIFFIFSLVFTSIGVVPYAIYLENKDECDMVTAIIVDYEVDYSDDDATYTFFVTYEYNGTIYSNKELDYSTSSMWLGDEVTIYVRKDNPEKFYSEPKELIPFMIMGLLMGLVPTIFLINKKKKDIRENNLKNTGRKVRCKIISVELDRTVRVNGKYVNSYLFCSPVDEIDGKTKYKSNSFATPKTNIYNYFVDVYIDRNDKTKYFVDLSFLFEEKDGYCKDCSEVDRDSLFSKPKVEYNHHTGKVIEKDIYCEYCCVRYSPKLKRCPNCKKKNKINY